MFPFWVLSNGRKWFIEFMSISSLGKVTLHKFFKINLTWNDFAIKTFQHSCKVINRLRIIPSSIPTQKYKGIIYLEKPQIFQGPHRPLCDLGGLAEKINVHDLLNANQFILNHNGCFAGWCVYVCYYCEQEKGRETYPDALAACGAPLRAIHIASSTTRYDWRAKTWTVCRGTALRLICHRVSISDRDRGRVNALSRNKVIRHSSSSEFRNQVFQPYHAPPFFKSPYLTRTNV